MERLRNIKPQKNETPAGERPKRGKGTIVLAVLVVLVALLFSLVDFITDWLWFKELGYVSVFFKQLFTQLKIGIPTFIIIALLTYIYLKALKKNYYDTVASDEEDKSKAVNVFAWVFAIAYGALITYVAVTRLWFEALQNFHAQDFGIKDPIFNLDASFYVFRLDFINHLNILVIGALIGLFIVTVLYYGVLLTLHTPNVFDTIQGTEDNPFAEPDAFTGEPPQGRSAAGEEDYSDGARGFFERMAKQMMDDEPGDTTEAGDFGGGLFGRLGRGGTRPKKRKKAGGSGNTFDDGNFKALLAIGSRQLMLVGILFFVMLAVHYFLQQFSLLYTHTGAVYGAGFTDVTVTLWMYRLLMVLALIGAVGVVMAVRKKNFKTVLTIPVIMIVVGLIGNGATMLVQNFIVSPDEIAKESKYLERNIKYTQYAYGLDNVSVQSFSAESGLTSEDLKNNEETISNIRINDYLPAETFYNQTQSIRQYYTFSDVDVDRYMVNGDYTQTFLSAREIDEEKISDTWMNRHLKYTHGYGITLSRVDKVTASGQPDMLIKNIPPKSDIEEVQITRPEVYFGELTNNYVVINTNEDEFDYPDGDSNKYTRYEGSAGIKMNFFNRLLFSARERSMKLLVSSNIKGDSRIIINRNIMDRVNTIFPYLSYDKDPYMCTVDGKLYWIIDAYTTNSKFPYSEPYSQETNTNYIRNSVKVVVDAYNGTVDYYVVDETDAIAKTYAEIYPKLFKSADQIPEGIKAHLRYPNTMFDVQANVYRRYHMNDVKVFYQNEDLWDIAAEIYGIDEQTMEPNYYILALPGLKTAEFVNSVPYTPRDKKNMTGLLVARNDGEHYGELILYQLPKSKVIYGPMQVEAQIDQSTEISKEFSLWNSSGSKYSRGNLFVIPIEDSLLYVEPVYLEATNSSIPEVKRVIVVYNDQIAYEPTLSAALESLFGTGEGGGGQQGDDQGGGSGGSDTELTQTEIIQQAQEAYDEALKRQREGDWAGYGEKIEELGELLEQLQ